MGRLTTIEDVEKQKAAAREQEEMRAGPASQPAKHAGQNGHTAEAQPARLAREQAPQSSPQAARKQAAAQTAAPAAAAPKSESQKEADFHGLDSLEKRSGGNIALIVIAVVIVIAAALKIAGVY